MYQINFVIYHQKKIILEIRAQLYCRLKKIILEIQAQFNCQDNNSKFIKTRDYKIFNVILNYNETIIFHINNTLDKKHLIEINLKLQMDIVIFLIKILDNIIQSYEQKSHPPEIYYN